MVNSAFLAAAAAGLFLASPVSAGLYLKSSPVVQVDAKNYDKLIAKSNHTSIVEFYAPWCGHCQNLKPAYEKAAKNLAGLANVAAVNCDEDSNKPLCGQFGVQGFPTLKIVRPSKKPGKPTVEDYQGARSAKAIVDAVVDKIPNHVKRITDDKLADFLKEGNDTAKAILFTDKGTTSALLRAVAIDFLGSISVAQIRNTQKEAVSAFGISTFPTLVLLPGGDKESIVYDGEMKKGGIVSFLSQVAAPNPDPATADSKKVKPSPKKDTKEKAPKEKVVETPDSSEATDPDAPKADSPPPVIIEEGPPMIQMLEHAPALEEACLQAKSQTCVLALLPQKPLNNPDAPLTEDAKTALASLGLIHAKHDKIKSKLFPFYSVPDFNSAGIALRREFGLKDHSKMEIVAINAKRNWWRHFTGSDFGQLALENWIDAIRMGEGKKEKIPAGVIPEEPEPVEEPAAEEQKPIQAAEEGAEGAAEETKGPEEEKAHDEL